MQRTCIHPAIFFSSSYSGNAWSVHGNNCCPSLLVAICNFDNNGSCRMWCHPNNNNRNNSFNPQSSRSNGHNNFEPNTTLDHLKRDPCPPTKCVHRNNSAGIRAQHPSTKSTPAFLWPYNLSMVFALC